MSFFRGDTDGTDSCGHGCVAGFVCQLITSFDGCSPYGAWLKESDDDKNDDNKDDNSRERYAARSTNPCQGLNYSLKSFLPSGCGTVSLVPSRCKRSRE